MVNRITAELVSFTIQSKEYRIKLIISNNLLLKKDSEQKFKTSKNAKCMLVLFTLIMDFNSGLHYSATMMQMALMLNNPKV